MKKRFKTGAYLRRILVLTLIVGIAGMNSGCSSILSGAHKTINVTSNPVGAQVDIFDGNNTMVAQGKTPFPVTLKRGAGYFKPAQYEFKGSLPDKPTKVVGYKNGINGWYWGNILLGGLIGMVIVDPITGAMWEPPAVVNIDFNQKN